MLLLALVAGGCGLFGRRNDPETRAAIAVSVDLGLVDAASLVRGSGRLWVRLMPSAGEALERELEWTMSGPGAPAAAEGSRLVADFRRDRAGLEPGVALFDDLAPGRYRISSSLVSARLERKGGDPVLLSLACDLQNVAPVDVAAGEVADLGRLSVSLLPGGRFDYRLAADDDPARFTRTLASRPDLAAFRPVRRASGARPAEPAATARRARAPAAGASPSAPTSGALALSPAAPAAAPDASPETGAAPAPPAGGTEVSSAVGTVGTAPGGRARPALLTGEPRAGGHVTVDPAAATSPLVPAGDTVRGSAIALGLVASVGPALEDATDGVGIIRLELRRLGRDAQRTIAEIGWELEEPTATADATGTAGAEPRPRAPRSLRLVAPGAPRAARGLALPLIVSPGEHEVVGLELTGKLRGGAGERKIAASIDLTAYGPIRVGPGELVDIGTLVLELRAADRIAVRPDATGAIERAEGILAASEPAAAGRRELIPVSRPLSPERSR
jgi:hypothetical protein